MTPTIASTLTALRNVGSAPVTLHLDSAIFPMTVVQDVATRLGGTFSVSSDGALIVLAAGPDAWDTVRQFAQCILAAALEGE